MLRHKKRCIRLLVVAGHSMNFTDRDRAGGKLFFRVDGLIEINPEYAGKQRDWQDQGQKQNDGPNHNAIDSPVRNQPEHKGNDHDCRRCQAVADVHGTEKIAVLTMKFEVTNRTAFMHFRKAAVNGRTKDLAAAASRAQLVENSGQGGDVLAFGHWVRKTD